jgi:hypothetical protein
MTAAGIGWPEIAAGLPNPPWYLTSHLTQAAIVAVGVLIIAYAFYLQANSEVGDGPAVKRLRFQKYITFREISDALSQAGSAYTKDEILQRLMIAVWQREFEQLSGHSRLRMTLFDDFGNAEERRIVAGPDLLDYGNESVARVIERSTFDAIMRGTESFPPGFVDSHVETLTIERGDFAQWLSRLRAGRYEAQVI